MFLAQHVQILWLHCISRSHPTRLADDGSLISWLASLCNFLCVHIKHTATRGPDLHMLADANAFSYPSRFIATSSGTDGPPWVLGCGRTNSVMERFIGGQHAGDHLDPSLRRPQIPTPSSPQLLSYYHNFSWLHVLQNVLCFIAWESEAGAAASAGVIRKAVMWKMKGATCPAERGVRVK